MRKHLLVFLLLFLVYSLAISWYLFRVDTSIPETLVGTAADPQTFMTAEQLTLSQEFATFRNLIYFINIPLEWLIYLVVLILGLSQRFRTWSGDVTRYSIVHTAIYVTLLSLITWALTFPLKWYNYQLAKEYQVSTQLFSDWFREELISFWVGVILLTIMVVVIYQLMKVSKKRWWFYTWLLSIPFTLVMMYMQPVVIDPLYNDFYPIQDQQLEQQILQLAADADIAADRVYEVNMSEKTNALNAYVTGIGDHLRIVLWDTTLEVMSEEAVLFVMAHEIGHFVLNHLPLLVVGSIVLSFFGLYLGYRLLNWSVKRFGERLGITTPSDIATVPILLLIFSLLSFAVSPFSNLVSREYEYQADSYAIEMTGDPEAAIDAFQQLTIAGLSDVSPPTLVKWFRYTHPPMIERISQFDQTAIEDIHLKD
ncbi:M48 family metallopeptidase [Desertibacillus haloalkaliphilus]|uniref:M48 family metallopeptidase n=1 Tax=Desertibacillus haloalkaliphilus TaxID=1328930 RepID=UPI001FE94D2C|nr:M48 family metallopeptidase [Desertibacillus haloalkaliphilus]